MGRFRLTGLVSAVALIMLLAACGAGGGAAESPSDAAATDPAETDNGTEGGYPEEGRSLTLIVPWAAGGGADTTARIIGPALEEQLGLTVEIVNQEGAGSQVGLSAFVEADPDGYTIANTAQPVTSALYLNPERETTFDFDSFAPIANVVSADVVLVVPADSPWQTLDDVAEAARNAPGELTFGAPGYLGHNHLASLQFQNIADVEMSLVQFEGGAPAATAILGGNIDMWFGIDSDARAYLESGDLRAIAVFAEEESPVAAYEGVPTATSQGYEVVQAATRGFSAPAGTPPEIVAELEAAFEAAINDEEVLAQLDEAGMTVRYLDSAEYSEFWSNLDEELAPLIEQALAEEGE